jgi:uncharacterized protein
VEKAICGDARLSAADSSLGVAYRTDLAQLSSISIGALRADQVQWLSWVQQLCHADDHAMQAPAMAACLMPLYGERIKLLRGAVVRRGGLSFLTRTQYLAAPDAGSPSGLEDHPGFGTLQASWPIADTDDDPWAAWNAAVEKRVLRMSTPTTPPPAGQPAKPLAWSDDLAAEQDTNVRALIKNIEKNRVTTGVSMDGMGHGAAHPFEMWETMTWVLDAKHILRAEDVFGATTPWKDMLADACWKQIVSGKQRANLYEQVNGPNAKQLREVIVNVGNWTLEHDGLHISYPEYSVSPRVAPMDDAVIPWNTLQNVLAPGFVEPN